MMCMMKFEIMIQIQSEDMTMLAFASLIDHYKIIIPTTSYQRSNKYKVHTILVETRFLGNVEKFEILLCYLYSCQVLLYTI